MKTINLRNYYPFYSSDQFLDVPDELSAMLEEYDRAEEASRRRTYRNKAHYSLDRGDGIELEAVFVSLSPCEIYESKMTVEYLHAAIATLPDKQAKRVYAHYFMGVSKAEIAKREGVGKVTVGDSIRRALRNLEIILNNCI